MGTDLATLGDVELPNAIPGATLRVFSRSMPSLRKPVHDELPSSGSTSAYNSIRTQGGDELGSSLRRQGSNTAPRLGAERKPGPRASGIFQRTFPTAGSESVDTMEHSSTRARTRVKRETLPIVNAKDNLRSNNLRSDSLRSDSLRSDRLKPDNLRSDSPRSNSLRSNNLRSDSLRSNNLRSDSLRYDNLRSDNLISDNLRSNSLRSDNLRSNSLRSDNLPSDSHRSDNLQSDRIRLDSLKSNSLRSDNRRSDNLRSDSLRSDSLRSDNLRSDSLRSNNLRSNSLRSDNLRSDSLRSDNLQSDSLRSDNLQSNSLTSDNLQSDSLRFDSLESDSFTFDNLQSDSFTFDNLQSDSFTFDNLQSDSLRSDNLQSDSLRSDNLKSDSLRSDNLRSDSLRSYNLKSDSLRSNNLQFDSFRSDNLRSDSLRSDNLRSDSLRYDDLISDGDSGGMGEKKLRVSELGVFRSLKRTSSQAELPKWKPHLLPSDPVVTPTVTLPSSPPPSSPDIPLSFPPPAPPPPPSYCHLKKSPNSTLEATQALSPLLASKHKMAIAPLDKGYSFHSNMTVTHLDRGTSIQSERSKDWQEFIEDIVMWRSVPRSSFIFGAGCFCILSASFMKDMHFNLISIVSYLFLFQLAIAFFLSTFTQGENMGFNPASLILSESDALKLLQLILPLVNSFTRKFARLFCGEPEVTLKAAIALWIVARASSFMSLWTFVCLAYLSVFIIPKCCLQYHTQMNHYVNDLVINAWVAWNGCHHKNAILLGAFLFIWNYSSISTRIWGAFVALVALRLYQLSQTEISEQEEDHQNRTTPPCLDYVYAVNEEFNLD